MGDGTVDRRRFIGLGLAAAGGASVLGAGSWTVEAALCWEATEGFPGRPNRLILKAPHLPDQAEVEVVVAVHGPDPDHPITELQRAHALVTSGEARIDADLAYPYDKRIPGRYRYVARVSWRGSAVATEAPATFELRPWLPLS